MSPVEEISDEKAKEAQSLIDKAKSLQKDGVIIDWPKVLEEEAAQVKSEDARDSSSSGLLLVGPPTCVDPG
eukprot:2250341-Karenia_brevis.AAC.1